MKARYLKKLLNNTEYIVHHTEDKLCIGSPLCSELIHMIKKDVTLRSALDWQNKGRESLAQDNDTRELLFIWDTLTSLIQSGEILSILQEDDVIEDPITVYSCEKGEVLKAYTDKLYWPNVTHSGQLMYNNTHSPDIKKIVISEIRNQYFRNYAAQKNLKSAHKTLCDAYTRSETSNGELMTICQTALSLGLDPADYKPSDIMYV